MGKIVYETQYIGGVVQHFALRNPQCKKRQRLIDKLSRLRGLGLRVFYFEDKEVERATKIYGHRYRMTIEDLDIEGPEPGE